VSTIAFHPIANVFPLIEGEDFQALCDDIQAHGLLEPVWLYGGKILDGRNRYRACEAIHRQCEFREYAGDDPVGFVVSMNLRRRHLTPSQCGMVAQELAKLGHGGDRRSEDFKSGIPLLKQEEAAALLNVSVDTVKQARKIHEEAAQQIIDAVKDGTLTLNGAMPLTELPKDEVEGLDSPEPAGQAEPGGD